MFDEAKKSAIAGAIVGLFDDFLINKGISFICKDTDEEAERHEDPQNVTALYGSEYWNLVDEVTYLLEDRGLFDNPEDDVDEAVEERIYNDSGELENVKETYFNYDDSDEKEDEFI